MRRTGWVAAALWLAQPAWAQDAEPAAGDTAPADYAQPSAWICRPGADDGTCSAGLDAMAVDVAGRRTPVPFHPAPAAAVDCFYVYPTASDDPTFYSDMAVDASEKDVVHAQAGRLSAVCRVFAPAYHQVTSAGLRWRMEHGKSPAGIIGSINGIPFRDVRAAWLSYLARDNGGRGVVLIGHSQGAILLKKLLAEEIDGRPAQRLLVGAYLAGNPDLGAGSFHAIRPCAAKGQTGCVVAWSSYAEGDTGPRSFGGSREGAAVCVNPAAPAGGRGLLEAILPRPSFAPEGDPPSVLALGQLSAECVADGAGAVLRVRVEPGRYADLLTAMLARSGHPGWGLHAQDIRLVQGNLVDDIAAQAAAWTRGAQAGTSSSSPPR